MWEAMQEIRMAVNRLLQVVEGSQRTDGNGYPQGGGNEDGEG